MGDFRDASLRPWRRLDVPWKQLGQGMQGNIVFEYQRLCRILIQKAVALIETKGRAMLPVTVKLGGPDYSSDKGIKVKLLIAEMGPELDHALVDNRGKMVTILMDAPDRFMGQRSPAQVDLHEPDLPFNAATGEVKEAGVPDPEIEGYAHGRAGGSDTANRYEPGTPESDAWLRGQGRGHAENVKAFAEKLEEGLTADGAAGRSAYGRAPRIFRGRRRT